MVFLLNTFRFVDAMSYLPADLLLPLLPWVQLLLVVPEVKEYLLIKVTDRSIKIQSKCEP